MYNFVDLNVIKSYNKDLIIIVKESLCNKLYYRDQNIIL